MLSGPKTRREIVEHELAKRVLSRGVPEAAFGVITLKMLNQREASRYLSRKVNGLKKKYLLLTKKRERSLIYSIHPWLLPYFKKNLPLPREKEIKRQIQEEARKTVKFFLTQFQPTIFLKTQKEDTKKWVGFGDKEFDCPNKVTQEMVEYLRNKKKLPHPCDKCYKGLIFWSYCYNEDNLNTFRKMVSSFDFEIRGKYDKNLAVFYFREKQELLDFLEILKEKMQEFGVNGIIQWRRACKAYQDELPEYWKNAKELKFKK